MCSDIQVYSCLSRPQIYLFFTSSHAHPLSKQQLHRSLCQMRTSIDLWEVVGGGDQDHMQDLNWEINIKNMQNCEKYCPGRNLCRRKSQECETPGTTNQLMSSLRRRMCRKTKVILRGWCRRKEKLIHQRGKGGDGLRHEASCDTCGHHDGGRIKSWQAEYSKKRRRAETGWAEDEASHNTQTHDDTLYGFTCLFHFVFPCKYCIFMSLKIFVLFVTNMTTSSLGSAVVTVWFLVSGGRAHCRTSVNYSGSF